MSTNAGTAGEGDGGAGTYRTVTEFLLRDLLHLDPERQCIAHIERAQPDT